MGQIVERLVGRGLEPAMRVLLYNFVQPDDRTPGKQGGGVAIYQRNLAVALQAAGHEVISLDSGDRYSFLDDRPRLETEVQGGVARAHIVNSPVFAPSHAAFHGVSAYAESRALNGVPDELRRRYGEIDIFHFQNVEGLTRDFFVAVRAAFPKARILMSAHNYSLVCPQVNLWFREHQACEDYRDGRACVNCLLSADHHLFEPNARKINAVLGRLRLKPAGRVGRAVHLGLRAALYLRRRLRREASPVREAAALRKKEGLRLVDEAKASDYAGYRRVNLALIDEVFDRVLAVSQRTRDVLVARGANPRKVAVSYIGTAQHRSFAKAQRRLDVGEGLHIAYLGYMRADKGFFFLTESLFAIPDDLAATMRITIAAPIRDPVHIERLRGLAHRFREIRIHDGYSHATLDTVLEGVNLGIVPVLWEDNLPQVAIEMASRGIPLLTSNRGGAQEIGAQDAFVFEAGSIRDFCRRLDELASGRTPLAAFWRNPTRIFSMETHLEDLMNHYVGGAATTAEAARPQLANVG